MTGDTVPARCRRDGLVHAEAGTMRIKLGWRDALALAFGGRMRRRVRPTVACPRCGRRVRATIELVQ